ncbi:MAG: hypothetical protein NC417_00910 [Candidatus Gastranaerophilales bacterium]|nr:hypothetical protein [Candidatus Gastranaerophilales bacterium]
MNKIKTGKKGKARRLLMFLAVLFAVAVVVGCALLFFYDRRTHHYHTDSLREEDVAALSTETYDGLLLSMCSPDAFDAEDFAVFRGYPVFKASHTFENLADIGTFLTEGFLQNPNLYTAYIMLDPDAVSSLYGDHASLYVKDYAKYLTDHAQAHPDTQFELLLPSYSLEYLQTMSDKEFDSLITACRNLVNICIPYNNMCIYFLADEEWLIANPGNFDNYNTCNPSVTHTILAYTFGSDRYVLNANNMEEHFSTLTELTHTPPTNYPDYSDYSLVFFGDSVFGLYTDSLSIPGVVNGLSHAKVFNIGLGGTSACGNRDPEVPTLNTQVDAFLAMDNNFFEEGSCPYIGISSYQAGHPDKHCFLLNYGLNDYFFGLPISTEDPYDPYTFSGGIRTAVTKLQDAYPDCKIILTTPNFTSYYNAGKDINSDEGGTMQDYVDAVLALAEELQVDCMNNYQDFGVTIKNHGMYLEDGCHPNEYLRYIYGQRIIEKLSDMLSTD